MSETPAPAPAETLLGSQTPPVEPNPTPPKDGTTLLTQPNSEPSTKPPEPKAGDKPTEPKAPPTGAPEKYEFKAPEGFEFDPKALEAATPVFKELGLTNDQAQKLMDVYAKQTAEAGKAPYQLWKDTQDAWVNEIKADPEIGGKLDTVRTTIAKAIDTLGPKLSGEFRQAMNITGAGNNPAFVRAMYKWSQSLTEGTAVSGNGPAPSANAKPRSAASAIYPNLAEG